MLDIDLALDRESRIAKLSVRNSNVDRYTRHYIVSDEKKQKSILRLLQSDKVVYSRFHGVSKGWCPVAEEYTEYMIDINNERAIESDFLLGRDESKPGLI